MTRREIRTQRREVREMKHSAEWPVTGWEPVLLQDASRGLTQWLSNRIDSRMYAREAISDIEKEKQG
jgi:hypothetical protein